jgi:hypothetical protein
LKNTGRKPFEIIVLCWFSFVSFWFCSYLVHTGFRSTHNTLSTVTFVPSQWVIIYCSHWRRTTDHSTGTHSKLNSQSALLQSQQQRSSSDIAAAANSPYINPVPVFWNFFMVLGYPSGYARSPVLSTGFRIVQLHSASVAELTRMSSRGGTHCAHIAGWLLIAHCKGLWVGGNLLM